VLAHPDAHYFDIGGILLDQLDDYAKRKGITVEKAKEMLGHNLV